MGESDPCDCIDYDPGKTAIAAGLDSAEQGHVAAGVRVETGNNLFAMIVDLMQGGWKEDRGLAPVPPQ